MDHTVGIPNSLHLCPGCNALASVQTFCDNCIERGVPGYVAMRELWSDDRRDIVVEEMAAIERPSPVAFAEKMAPELSPAARAWTFAAFVVGTGFAWRLIWMGVLRVVALLVQL